MRLFYCRVSPKIVLLLAKAEPVKSATQSLQINHQVHRCWIHRFSILVCEYPVFGWDAFFKDSDLYLKIALFQKHSAVWAFWSFRCGFFFMSPSTRSRVFLDQRI